MHTYMHTYTLGHLIKAPMLLNPMRSLLNPLFSRALSQRQDADSFISDVVSLSSREMGPGRVPGSRV